MNNRAASQNRKKFDQYFTPEWATLALLDHEDIPKSALIGEPCAGAGHIVKALRDQGYHTIAGEIDPLVEPIAKDLGIEHGLDFLQTDPAYFHSPDWIITNPPYTLQEQIFNPDGTPARTKKGKIRYRTIATAADFFRRAMNCAPNVAMLLRLGWLEACKDRVDILPQLSPPIILPRVEFIGADGNGNSSPSVWCIWKKEENTSPGIIWADRDRCRELQG